MVTIMIGIIKKVLLVTVFVFSNSLIAQVDRSVMPESGPAPEIKFGTPKTFLLDNGLTVMVVENSKLPRASATLNFNNPPLNYLKSLALSLNNLCILTILLRYLF